MRLEEIRNLHWFPDLLVCSRACRRHRPLSSCSQILRIEASGLCLCCVWWRWCEEGQLFGRARGTPKEGGLAQSLAPSSYCMHFTAQKRTDLRLG